MEGIMDEIKTEGTEDNAREIIVEEVKEKNQYLQELVSDICTSDTNLPEGNDRKDSGEVENDDGGKDVDKKDSSDTDCGKDVDKKNSIAIVVDKVQIESEVTTEQQQGIHYQCHCFVHKTKSFTSISADDTESFVEEYLDEEYLEYETAEGESISQYMTPVNFSESDDDDSDTSPVMAYLEKTENLSFYKNRDESIKNFNSNFGSENVSKMAAVDSEVTRINKQTPVNINGALNPRFLHFKALSEPRQSVLKKLKSQYCISDKTDLEVSTASIKRSRKQRLEPANVEVVFEVEKVVPDDNLNTSKPKKRAYKQRVQLDKPKRKWTRRKLDKSTPQTDPTLKLPKRSYKKKICRIASCKCDLEHPEQDSSDKQDSEDASDYSDEWQLPKKVNITPSNTPKIKVYTNSRKRQLSHKSTYDDHEDLSNDLLTLIKEDEKSDKEIDLSLYPEDGDANVSPTKRVKTDEPGEAENFEGFESIEDAVLKLPSPVKPKRTKTETISKIFNKKEAANQVCEVCRKEFRTKTRLMLHKKTHTGEQPRKSARFTKTIAKPEAPNKNLRRTIVKMNVYKCPDCSAEFKNTILLRRHKTTCKVDNKVVKTRPKNEVDTFIKEVDDLGEKIKSNKISTSPKNLSKTNKENIAAKTNANTRASRLLHPVPPKKLTKTLQSPKPQKTSPRLRPTSTSKTTKPADKTQSAKKQLISPKPFVARSMPRFQKIGPIRPQPKVLTKTPVKQQTTMTGLSSKKFVRKSFKMPKAHSGVPLSSKMRNALEKLRLEREKAMREAGGEK